MSVFVRWCLRARASASVSACVLYVVFVTCVVYVMSSFRSLLLDSLYIYIYIYSIYIYIHTDVYVYKIPKRYLRFCPFRSWSGFKNERFVEDIRQQSIHRRQILFERLYIITDFIWPCLTNINDSDYYVSVVTNIVWCGTK